MIYDSVDGGGREWESRQITLLWAVPTEYEIRKKNDLTEE